MQKNLEFNNQRIMTTKVLAEQYGTEENNINKNFSNNKERFIGGKHYFQLTGEELKEFKRVVNISNDPSMKFISVLTLWTDRGAARHAKILDTDEAWEVYEELEESYFNIRQALPMSKELQAILMLDQKAVEIDNRVTKLENTMTIDYEQQETLNRCARARLVEILGGKESKAYKELSKKVFSSLWNMYKQVFNVNSYKNTAKKDYDRALAFINSWEPSKEVSYMIIGANSQMSFS